ncbi:hypothetical protein [Mesorhizobium sp. M0041]|uniref:hypothetical protein n=1 Tax=Mesorhizobium sp. M0041 TaxID=2956856 RepID=UPI003335F721
MLDKTVENSKQKSGSEKRLKFVELAENRTKNAIKMIKVIAKLANKNAYEYTETDVKKIVKALTKEVDALEARMMSTGGKDEVDFKL